MATGRCNRQRSFGHLLTAHVSEVHVITRILIEQFRQARRNGIDVELPDEERDRFGERTNGDHIEVFHDGRFGGAVGRNDDAAEALLFGG